MRIDDKALLERAVGGDQDAAAAWFLAHQDAIESALEGMVPEGVRPTLTTHNLLDTVRDMFVMTVAGEGEGAERGRPMREYDAMRIVQRIARGVVIEYEKLAELLPHAVRDVADLADELYETIAERDPELTVEEILEHCGDDRARRLLVLVLQGNSLKAAAGVLELEYEHAKTVKRRAIEEVRAYAKQRDEHRDDP